MSIARKIYEKTKVGTTGGIQASSIHSELEAFKAVVDDFDKMEAEGLIEITTRHRESQSGKHYVDHVKFKRLK